MEALKLGVLARDKVSGFEGIVMARTEWAYGCTRVGLYPTATKEDGGLQEDQWFDERQVEQIGQGVVEDSWVSDFGVAEGRPGILERGRNAVQRMAGTGGPDRPTGGPSKETG